MANNKAVLKSTRDKRFTLTGDKFTLGEFIDYEIKGVDIVDGSIYLIQIKHGME